MIRPAQMALMIYKKWDVALVDLNPIKGIEISKIRPYLVVSPNSVNTYINTIVAVPLTSIPSGNPFRTLTNQKNIEGELCFEHIKSIDKSRIVTTDGSIAKTLRTAINNLLFEFFNE